MSEVVCYFLDKVIKIVSEHTSDGKISWVIRGVLNLRDQVENVKDAGGASVGGTARVRYYVTSARANGTFAFSDWTANAAAQKTIPSRDQNITWNLINDKTYSSFRNFNSCHPIFLSTVAVLYRIAVHCFHACF